MYCARLAANVCWGLPHSLPGIPKLCFYREGEGKNMLRMIGIVLVIWGLIAQPLMAAMPDSMHLGESSSSMSMDDGDLDIVMSHPGTMGADQPSQLMFGQPPAPRQVDRLRVHGRGGALPGAQD